MVFVTIVDEDASMATKTAGGLCHLDFAKAGIESFLSQKTRTLSRGQAFPPMMLLRSGEKKDCIKSYINDPLPIFEREMKYMDCVDNSDSPNDRTQNTDFSYSLSIAFSILNKHRFKNGSDVFGFGRQPWKIDPATVFLFTNKFGQKGNDLIFSRKGAATTDLVGDPFKWDHRVYLFVCVGADEKESVNINPDLTKLCQVSLKWKMQDLRGYIFILLVYGLALRGPFKAWMFIYSPSLFSIHTQPSHPTNKDQSISSFFKH
jgi:hypothetical protein